MDNYNAMNLSDTYGTGNTRIENDTHERRLWDRYIHLMQTAQSINDELMGKGMGRFGWWIGSDRSNFESTYQPVFIFSQPNQIDEGDTSINRYFGLSPMGPISISFKNESGDHEEEELFLQLLNRDQGEIYATQRLGDSPIKLGLRNTDNGLELSLDPHLEDGVSEGNGDDQNFWLSIDVDNQELRDAIERSKEASLKPKEKTEEEKRFENLDKTADMVEDQLSTIQKYGNSTGPF